MNNFQRKKLAVRAFTGMVGREPGPTARSRPKSNSDVLLHYCFDQLAGETKREHCSCEERAVRVSHELAEKYVKEELADWLRVKNGRSRIGFSDFHRAIVVRSEVVDGNRLFKVPSPWTDLRATLPAKQREQKHEYIKIKIRGEARSILSTLFSKGVIAQDAFTRYQNDAALDELFQNTNQLDAFLKLLTDHGQHELRNKFRAKVIYWWNNVLGYLNSSMVQGRYMANAGHGVGAVCYKGDSNHIDIIDGARETGTGRVGPANFKPSYWCGGWDYSKGHEPSVDETEEDRTDRIIQECEGTIPEGDN